MRGNMGKWPWQVAFGTQEDRKPGHQMAAEIICFPRTGYGGMILTNLEVIWEMSIRGFIDNFAYNAVGEGEMSDKGES